MNTLRTFQQSNDPFTLASLPSDIIRNIIRLDEESLDELRLIGRSWNAQVLELYSTDSLSVVSFHYDQQYRSHVYMYAQMPARNKGRIGLNQWLTISLWSDEVFEVESELFYLGVPRVVYSEMILPSSWTQWIIIVCGFLIFGIRFGLVVIPKIVHYLYKRSAINNTVDGFVNHFKRFFSLFSSIDTLQLSNFVSDNVFNNVLKTIENKRIGRLEMQVDKWDRTLQYDLFVTTNAPNSVDSDLI
uniref:Uncharacterized protein n=1 Tax=Pristionchus pacificus TaxID=54126 RepID=A0A2A6BP85_PRIPA|eukprot:PDM67714.1 hypothetical protein PRIPAC_45758 [Pristionchus pacificus]